MAVPSLTNSHSRPTRTETTVLRNYRLPVELDEELHRVAARDGESMTSILVRGAARELAERNGDGS